MATNTVACHIPAAIYTVHIYEVKLALVFDRLVSLSRMTALQKQKLFSDVALLTVTQPSG